MLLCGQSTAQGETMLDKKSSIDATHTAGTSMITEVPMAYNVCSLSPAAKALLTTSCRGRLVAIMSSSTLSKICWDVYLHDMNTGAVNVPAEDAFQDWKIGPHAARKQVCIICPRLR